MKRMVDYRPEMRDAIISLMGGLPYKESIWDWQFTQNPFDCPFDPVVVVEDGRVVGFNGVMAIRVTYNGQEIDALWSCDFYVDAGCRGQGLGQQIKEALIKKSPLIMSFGISNAAAPVLLKMGWKSNHEVFNYRRIRYPSSIRNALLMLLQFYFQLRGGFKKSFSPYHLVVADSLPESAVVDALWVENAHTYQKAVIRNWRYLDWKYQQHPLAKYRFLIASQAGELKGLAVLREYKEVARMVDYLGPAADYSLQRALVSAFVKHYSDKKSLSCTTSSDCFGRALLDKGFFRARTQPRFYVRSELSGDIDCERKWFIMGGDSDGEILLAASEAMNTAGPG